MRRLVMIGMVLVIAVGAMVVGAGGNQPAAAAELETFPDCPALLERLKTAALDHVGPYGLEGTPMPMPIMGREVAVEESAATDTAAPASGEAAGAGQAADGSSSYTSETGTNVQVVGVDEPDHVKLSGDVLAIIEDSRIRLLDVSGTAPTPVGMLDLSGSLYPFTMLASGDRLVVFGHPVEDAPDEPTSSRGDAVDIAYAPWQPGTVVAIVDVSTPSAPRELERARIGGNFVSGRLTGGQALVVTSSHPNIPFVHPAGGPVAEERAEAANRDAVQDSTIDQWLAAITFADGSRRLLADCERVGVPTEIVSWQSVSIAAFDPETGLNGLEAAGTIGAGDTVYASRDRVYVAGGQWDPESQTGSTAVHAFATGAPPAYIASGEVDGNLLNQFSMDRYEGHLRIATTTQDVNSGDTDSRVVVLAESGQQLVEVGKVTGLGRPGETIRGIRYLGPIGFVVTFQQTDPLYTVDLSDPTAPRVLGELKIPGYSAYLHPTAEGQLLGVGSAATPDGRVTGLQVSLFDVSDLSAPAQVDVLEMRDAATPVEWDHHAFTWIGDQGIAVVPFEAWGGVQPAIVTPEPAPEPTETEEGSATGTEESVAPGESSPGEPGEDEPMPTEPPASEIAEHTAGLLLIQVVDGRLQTVATVAGEPDEGGWTAGFQRTVVHDGTLLAVGHGAVWRVAYDGTVVAKTSLN